MLGFLANGVPIARVFGLEVRVHVSWVLILAIVALGVGAQFEVLQPRWPAEVRWVAATVIAFLFFLSVVAHEVAHGAAARRRGLEGGTVTLLFFGGTTSLGQDPERPSDEAIIAGAGPAASFGLAALAIGMWKLLSLVAGDSGTGASAADEVALSTVIAESALVLAALNLLLGGVNLLPVFPLDGGRILRAALWRVTRSERRATRTVAALGRAFGMVLIGGGVLLALMEDIGNGVLLLLSGWFLAGAARALQRRVALEELLSGVRVDSVMDTDLPTVAPQLTLDTFAAQYLRAADATSLPVVRDASLLGLIGMSQLRRVPRTSWPTTRAGDVMVTPPALPTLAPEDELLRAVERMRRTGLDGIPVMRGPELLGVLTRRGVVQAIQARIRSAGMPVIP
jgi:Zn-dependent protease/CBS domain-containing protein